MLPMGKKSNEFAKRSGIVTGRFEHLIYAIGRKLTTQVPAATVHLNRPQLEWLLEDAPENINAMILERTFQKDPQIGCFTSMIRVPVEDALADLFTGYIVFEIHPSFFKTKVEYHLAITVPTPYKNGIGPYIGVYNAKYLKKVQRIPKRSKIRMDNLGVTYYLPA